MANMGYCRFTNTKNDLIDCKENLFDELSPEEARARKVLIELCHEIANECPLDEIKDLPIEK